MEDGTGLGAFTQATGLGLEDVSGADQKRYRAYQFDLISEHCGPSVLEVGAGLGDFASQFVGLKRLVVTDVDPACVRHMDERFRQQPEVEARQLDLEAMPVDAGALVSTVLAINVLEHIEQDSATLRSLAKLVEPGGNIVLWVPGYMQLYGEFDRSVGHVRRYTPATLRKAIADAGLECTEARPVNMLGAIAWWIAVRRGGVSSPRASLLRVYDLLVVPATRLLESVVTPPFGQTVLAVATKPS